MLRNYAAIDEKSEMVRDITSHRTLGDVLAWAGRQPEGFIPQVVAEVVTQDEYTHDVIVPYDGLYLVYDTT